MFSANIDRWLEVGMLIVTFFIAISAWRTAKAASVAAKEAAMASQSQLFIQLITEYGSNQMHEDLKKLSEFSSTEGAVKAVELKASKIPKEVDLARRRVKNYFLKSVRLQDNNFLSKSLLRVICDVAGRKLLTDVVMPLTIATAASDELAEIENEWVRDLNKLFEDTTEEWK